MLPLIAIALELGVPVLVGAGLVTTRVAESRKRARRKKVCVPINKRGKYFAGVLASSKDLRTSKDLRPYKAYLARNADKLGLSKGRRRSLGI